MTDWADEMAGGLCGEDWDGWHSTAQRAIANALRKAKADGMREAAVSVCSGMREFPPEQQEAEA